MFLVILFESNQTDTHKTFLIESEDFFSDASQKLFHTFHPCRANKNWVWRTQNRMIQTSGFYWISRISSFFLPFLFLLGRVDSFVLKGLISTATRIFKPMKSQLVSASSMDLVAMIFNFFSHFSFAIWHLSFIQRLHCNVPKVFTTLIGLPCQTVSWSVIFHVCFGVGSLSNHLAKWWA